MRIEEQFSRYAKSYLKYSIVQQKGSEILTKHLPKNLKVVADLGCGNGRLFKEIKKSKKEFKKFYGIDFSKEMLKLHPKDVNVELIVGDFNSIKLFDKLKNLNLDYLISASALQWAKDLDFTLQKCSKVAPKGAFFIFTSGTFKSLHQCANIKSPIYTKEEVLTTFNRYYKNLTINRYNFRLKFNNTLQMLRYIKKSGVSGGKMHLSYKEIKQLINKYHLDYLEFETFLLIGDSK